MIIRSKSRPVAKVWLEFKGEPLLGEGGAEILEAIKREKAISRAARSIGMSYRYVWNYLAKTERALGEPIVRRFKGGKAGGGGAELVALGESLLKEYRRVESHVGQILGNEKCRGAVGLKTNARHSLKGVVKSVERGELVTEVKVEVTVPTVIIALIPTEAFNALNIETGDPVDAVIKATGVISAKQK